MKNQIKPALVKIGIFAGFLALSLTPAFADSIMHARISYDAGGGLVKGTDDADWSHATVNTLILPGDTVWVDQQGTLELELSGGTFLRMADGSKAEVASLPPSGHVRGWTGSFYVQRINRSAGDFIFETPLCMISVERDSQVRIDILSEGSTTVSVRWGRAVVRGKGGGAGHETALTRGLRSYVDPGYLPSEPVVFDTAIEDDFDNWNRERARLLAVGTEFIPDKTYVEPTVIGAADLEPYGEWVYVDSVRYWRPTVVVDFVPYRHGRWSYMPAYGYVWVGDYPFSYVTGHYGRWHHHASYGWIWTYRDTWGPAWVASVRHGSNFVWCPLDPWDHPCVTSASVFTVGDVRFGVYASTYCIADDLFLGPCVVRPCTPVVVHGVPAAQIHVWNIYSGHHHPPRRPAIHYDSRMTVRDYAPRRVIRGPEFYPYGKESRSARARVATLQKAPEASRFGGNVTIATRNRATRADARAQTTHIRSVRLDSGATPTVHNLATRGEANAWLGRSGRTRSLRTTGDRAPSASGQTVPPSTRSSSSTSRSTRTSVPSSGSASARPSNTSVRPAPSKSPQVRSTVRHSAPPSSTASSRSRVVSPSSQTSSTRSLPHASTSVRTSPSSSRRAVPAAPQESPPSRTVRPSTSRSSGSSSRSSSSGAGTSRPSVSTRSSVRSVAPPATSGRTTTRGSSSRGSSSSSRSSFRSTVTPRATAVTPSLPATTNSQSRATSRSTVSRPSVSKPSASSRSSSSRSSSSSVIRPNAGRSSASSRTGSSSRGRAR